MVRDGIYFVLIDLSIFIDLSLDRCFLKSWSPSIDVEGTEFHCYNVSALFIQLKSLKCCISSFWTCQLVQYLNSYNQTQHFPEWTLTGWLCLWLGCECWSRQANHIYVVTVPCQHLGDARDKQTQMMMMMTMMNISASIWWCRLSHTAVMTSSRLTLCYVATIHSLTNHRHDSQQPTCFDKWFSVRQEIITRRLCLGCYALL